jgi:hypothetical protein
MPSRASGNGHRQQLVRDYIGYLIPIAGTAICMVVAAIVKDINEYAYDVFRDLAIGFFVALVVTIIYEVYARRRYEDKNFINTLQVIMNEVVHQDVWEEVRNQVIEKKMIREEVEIRLSLEPHEGLPKGQMVLCLEVDYDLCGLRSKPESVSISHYLDDHIECKKNDLPRFELIEIENGPVYQDDSLKEKVDRGKFSVDILLKSRYERQQHHINTKRKEITYVPGSYILIMGELTRGVKFKLESLPAGIDAYLHLWPHTDKPVQLIVGKTNNDFNKKVLLPGQGCEFRFYPRTISDSATRPESRNQS